MITIKEISKLSGYSSSTVSRVLNNKTGFQVNNSTREHIIKIAKENGYDFSKGKSDKKEIQNQKIAILIHESGDTEVTNPYYEKLKNGISIQCHYVNLTPIFYNIHQLSEASLRENFIGVISVGTINPQLIHSLTGIKDNIVYIGQSFDYRKYSSVEADLDSGTKDALKLLFNNNIKDIQLIVGNSTKVDHNLKSISIVNQRYKSYREVMERMDLFNEDMVTIGDYTINSGYVIMQEKINSGNLSRAFIIGNDLMAIGALKALQNSNTKVPEEVAIVSYDDSDLAEYASTPLSSIRIKSKDLGKISVKLLIELISYESQIMRVLLPANLIIRDSAKLNTL